MGNREKLLEGALACLYDKGYARTTARDIAAAAGVSLAAIGYHFGTTEALLSTVLYQAMEQWGEELERALVDEHDRDLDPADRFIAIWDRVIGSVNCNRPLWVTQFELVTQFERLPELRKQYVDAQEQAQFGLAALFQGIDPAVDPELARSVGGLLQALLTGVIVQHLVNPDNAPSGHDLARALRALTL